MTIQISLSGGQQPAITVDGGNTIGVAVNGQGGPSLTATTGDMIQLTVTAAGAPGGQGVQGPPGSVNLSDETPQALGTAAAGTSSDAARADHVHAVPSIAYSSLTGVPSTFTPATHTHTASAITDFATEAAKYGPVTSVNGQTGDITVSGGGGSYTLPTASDSTLGGVKVGSGLSISSGVLSADAYSLPTATDKVLGGIKVGSGLSISSGVLSATGGGGSFSGTVDGGDYVGTGGGGGNSAPETDPLYSSVKLLLHGEYVTDSTVNASVVAYGNAAATTARPKFGAKSYAFDGNGDYLIAQYSSGSYAPGTGAFTAEAWVWLNALPSNASNNGFSVIFDSQENDANNPTHGFNVGIQQSGQFYVYWGHTDDGGSMYGGSASAQTWYHVALVRSEGSMRLYVNGILAATSTTNATIDLNSPTIYLGRSAQYSSYQETNGLLGYLNGYLDEVRITKAARYTGTSTTGTNFTLPTAAFPDS